ncbi:MAG: hypothetical protein P4M14_10780 [Gammaproteobacteria bacterium]|nr:hypothetical protein [Gammaproteobacteria bacterium]
MLQVAIVLLIFAAILGSVVLIAILKNHRTPKPVVVAHGSVAGFALLLIFTYIAMGHTDTLVIAGAIVLLIAAIGGFILFGLDVFTKRPPKVMAIVHPIIGISGIVLLITYFLAKQSS